MCPLPSQHASQQVAHIVYSCEADQPFKRRGETTPALLCLRGNMAGSSRPRARLASCEMRTLRSTSVCIQITTRAGISHWLPPQAMKPCRAADGNCSPKALLACLGRALVNRWGPDWVVACHFPTLHCKLVATTALWGSRCERFVWLSLTPYFSFCTMACNI